jgi:hypothetical protein
MYIKKINNFINVYFLKGLIAKKFQYNFFNIISKKKKLIIFTFS